MKFPDINAGLRNFGASYAEGLDRAVQRAEEKRQAKQAKQAAKPKDVR